jgi:hypothetical protein
MRVTGMLCTLSVSFLLEHTFKRHSGGIESHLSRCIKCMQLALPRPMAASVGDSGGHHRLACRLPDL